MKSGYIKNYPVRFSDGYSSITVDNSQNDSDVFVKLFSLDSKPEQPIRVFFIRASNCSRRRMFERVTTMCATAT